MLTFISLEQLNALEYEMSEADYKPNTAQKLLAAEVTRFVHGEEGLKQAESATQVTPLFTLTFLGSRSCNQRQHKGYNVRKNYQFVIPVSLTHAKSESMGIEAL